VFKDNLDSEDSDVKAERTKVEKMQIDEKAFKDYPLIINNIRKQYSTGKVANKAMCLTVDKNIVFGLLGPNGAGVSTYNIYYRQMNRYLLEIYVD
jgi:hypothetical protein